MTEQEFTLAKKYNIDIERAKQILEYQSSINVAQQGDYMSNLASQYGISNERAQQLLQMGGEAEQQEPQQSEGIEQQVMEALQNGAQPEEILQQLSQQMPPEQAQQIIEQVMAGSEEGQSQQEGSQDIMGMVMEALQNGADPNQVVQGLIEQGVEEQEAVNIVSEMTQGEHQMQSGGQVYAQQGRIGSKLENQELYKKQNPTSKSWGSFGELLKENPTEVLGEMKRLHPELYSKYFKDDKIPTYDKIKSFQEGVNSKYEDIKKDYVKKYGADSEQVKNINDMIGKDKFLPMREEYDEKQDAILNKEVRGMDSFLGNYTSTRPNFAIEVLPKEDLNKVNKEGVSTASQLKEKFPELYNKYVKPQGLTSDFWLGEVPKTDDKKAEEPSIGTPAENRAKIQYNSAIQNIMPQLPMDLRLAPSAMQPLAKEYVPYGRIDPLKATPEQMLTEQERQRQTDAERVQQSGLSAGQQEAVLAQGLVASQMASNDAISKTQDWNNQNQFQVNTFNNQQRTKEAISNAQFNQDYQNKASASIVTTERDWRNYYTEGNLQNRADYNSIENNNLLNANSDKYAYIPGQGVQFLNTQKQDISIPNKYSVAEWKLMTMEEKAKAQKEQIDSNFKKAQMGGKKKAYFGY